MTIYTLAFRIREIADLQEEFDQTRNQAVLDQINDRQLDLNILVNSIINTYHVPETADCNDYYVDVDQFGQ